MNIVRSSDAIKKDLSSQDTYTRTVAIVENHIASLPQEEHHSARQNIPYLLQFYPNIVKLWPNKNLLPYVNPELKWSGLTGYSKDQMHEGFDKNRMLTYELISSQALADKSVVRSILSKFGYPCVVKPDTGERSSGVKVLENSDQFDERYEDVSQNTSANQNYLVQQYDDSIQEYGLQFYRIGNGFEVTLAQKNIPSVVGDGKRTLSELIDASSYKEIYKSIFRTENKSELLQILKQGEIKVLTKKVTIAHGTTFSGVSITDEQQEKLSGILLKILAKKPNLYVGRFDIKANSLGELLEGKFTIIECNGVGGIPLHVYDESKSIVEKYQSLKKHYDRVVDIAKKNTVLYSNIEPMSAKHWVKFWYDCITSVQSKDVSVSQKFLPQLGMILYTILVGKFRRIVS